MSEKTRPQGYFLVFLSAVMVLFVSLLVLTWYGASKANPVMLDEQGRVR